MKSVVSVKHIYP